MQLRNFRRNLNRSRNHCQTGIIDEKTKVVTMGPDEEFSLDRWYKDNYNAINATAVQNSLPNRILHKLIERPFKSNDNLSILEVGANRGEHVPFVTSDFKSYLMTDVRPLDQALSLEDFSKVTDDTRIEFQIGDVQNLHFEKNTFDRTISTCLFHHLENPMEAFREVRRVTKKGGMISILIPNDPGILYRILRSMTTLRLAKKNNCYKQVQLVHAIEHRNHYLQLESLLREVFRNDVINTRSFPLIFRSYNLNAITIFHIKKL